MVAKALPQDCLRARQGQCEKVIRLFNHLHFPGSGDPGGHPALHAFARNLIYTGITRGKRLLVLIGQKKALGIAVRNDRPQRRYSGLLASLRSDTRTTLA